MSTFDGVELAEDTTSSPFGIQPSILGEQNSTFDSDGFISVFSMLSCIVSSIFSLDSSIGVVKSTEGKLEEDKTSPVWVGLFVLTELRCNLGEEVFCSSFSRLFLEEN